MTVLMYHKRFAPPILAGTKTQTIRPDRKRPIEVGDALSHRIWEDVAYRSRQVELLANRCIGTFVIRLTIDFIQIGVGSVISTASGLDEFSIRDGFESWAEMRSYWVTGDHHYGFPFTGVLILHGVTE